MALGELGMACDDPSLRLETSIDHIRGGSILKRLGSTSISPVTVRLSTLLLLLYRYSV